MYILACGKCVLLGVLYRKQKLILSSNPGRYRFSSCVFDMEGAALLGREKPGIYWSCVKDGSVVER